LHDVFKIGGFEKPSTYVGFDNGFNRIPMPKK